MSDNAQLTPEQSVPTYIAIESNSLRDLVVEVNGHMAEGWRPLGGVALTVSNYENRDGFTESSYTYAQAMWKL